jgi:hypothetical protein
MTLLSGNTFGARTWTDGRQVAPMLPHPPPVVRCSHCHRFFWLRDAKNIGAILSLEEPSEQDYYSAIAGGLAKDAAEEKTLRVLAWWRGNDEYRGESGRPARRPWRLSPEARENVERLVALLSDEDISERIMMAEALRELGEFDAATRLLAGFDAGDAATAVSRIRELCERGDPRLRVLHSDE